MLLLSHVYIIPRTGNLAEPNETFKAEMGVELLTNVCKMLYKDLSLLG
jgi:hypothetical protein